MITVQSGQGCTWTSSNPSNVTWINGLSNGVGNGTVLVEVSKNTGPARSTTLVIGGVNVMVNQADGCRVTSVMPTSTTVFGAGGTGTFTVNSAAGCAWTAMSNASWITGVTPSGTGQSTVNFTVEPNPGQPRNGTITVGGVTYTVMQNVGSAPRITTQPQGTTVNEGQSFSLSVVAEGLGLTYQWRKNGMDIPGQTNPSYMVTSATPADGDTYDVIVTNMVGSAMSDPAVVMVIPRATDAGFPDVSTSDAPTDAGSDAGTAMNDAATDAGSQPGDSSAIRDSGTGAENSAPTGCACRVPAQPTRSSRSGLALAALAGLALLASRRRTRA
jgi:MYXO-CTERM domain-containing protein